MRGLYIIGIAIVILLAVIAVGVLAGNGVFDSPPPAQCLRTIPAPNGDIWYPCPVQP